MRRRSIFDPEMALKFTKARSHPWARARSRQTPTTLHSTSFWGVVLWYVAIAPHALDHHENLHAVCDGLRLLNTFGHVASPAEHGTYLGW